MNTRRTKKPKKRIKLLGQHLVFPRESRLYDEHHGICISPISVMHYSGAEQDQKKGEVKTGNISNLTGPKGLYVRRYKELKEFSPEPIRRAHSQFGKDKYNPLLNNCEHFATWCMIEKKISFQIIRRLVLMLQVDSFMTPTLMTKGLLEAIKYATLSGKKYKELSKLDFDKKMEAFEKAIGGIDYEDVEEKEYLKKANYPSKKVKSEIL